MVAIYDMGEGQQRLVEDSRYFDDGQYHVVRFFRSNNDGTLQVDTLPIRERKPIGKETYLFLCSSTQYRDRLTNWPVSIWYSYDEKF